MEEKELTNDHEIKVSRKFTSLYVIALSAVALLSIGGQVLVQMALKAQSNDARVINIAGRQRMLSQNICKNILLLGGEIDTLHRETHKNELDESLAAWHIFHTGLQLGNPDTLEGTNTNSDTIIRLFQKIEPHFLVIYNNAQTLSNTLAISTPTYRRQLIHEILIHEKIFLKGMDAIVATYAQEAKARVDRLKGIELLLLVFTLVILTLEGLLIFRPAVTRLTITMQKLIASEANEKIINRELAQLNTSLRRTEQELLESANEKYKRELSEQKIRSTSLVQGQETERIRIARDIHDGIGQMLTALKLNLESIVPEQLPEKEQARLEEARKLIARTIVETRTITFNLMPTVLSDYGIVSALRQLSDQASRNSGVNVDFI